jgi:hypothetical protein
MPVCIQVTRSDSGTYEIPGAAEPEPFDDVQWSVEDRGGHVERVNTLKGWDPWEEVWTATLPADGPGRSESSTWYFVAREEALLQHYASRIAHAHFTADSSQLAPGETLETTEPTAWMTGAGSIHEDLEELGISYDLDPEEMATQVRRVYREMVQEATP